jgi:integrase
MLAKYAIRSKGVGAITQTDLAHLADALYSDATAQTHNRQIYSPVIAVLHFGGVERKFKRPKGWRGKKTKSSLEMEQAFALLNEAEVIDTEFGLLCYTCLYTGRRIGELLNDDTRLRDLNLKRGTLYLRDTKNGEPVTVHLPPILIEKFKAMPPRPYRHGKIKGRSQDNAGVPFLERDPDQRLFVSIRAAICAICLPRQCATLACHSRDASAAFICSAIPTRRGCCRWSATITD